MRGQRGTARTCDECGRSWGRRATYCGACGARLVEVAPTRQDAGTPTGSVWRSPARLLAVLAGVAVVVGAAVAVPAITVGRSQAVDGDVALPTEGGARDRAPDTPTGDGGLPSTGALPDPPSVTCLRGGQRIPCVAWTADVSGPEGPNAPGAFGPVGHFGRTVLVVSGTRVTALDETTGRPRWHHDASTSLDGARVESGMVGIDADGRFHLLAVATGQREWTVEADGNVFGDLLYGGLVYAAAPPGPDDADESDLPPALTARRIEDGGVAWRWEPPPSWADDGFRPPDAGPPPLVVRQVGDRHILVESYGAGVAALDARTGEVRWQQDDVRILAADEHVAVAQVVTEETGSEPVQPRPTPPPTILTGLDPATGEVAWRHEAPTGERGGWTSVQDDLVLVPTGGDLQALDRATGEVRWSVEGPEQPQVPFVPPGTDLDPSPVVVTSDQQTGRLRARSPDSGEIRWEVDTPNALARPVGNHVVVEGGMGGGVDYLDAATGTPVLRVEAPRSLMPLPFAPDLLFDMQSRHVVALLPGLLDAD